MLADIRRRFMSKEAIFSPDFPAPGEGDGFAADFRMPVRFPTRHRIGRPQAPTLDWIRILSTAGSTRHAFPRSALRAMVKESLPNEAGDRPANCLHSRNVQTERKKPQRQMAPMARYFAGGFADTSRKNPVLSNIEFSGFDSQHKGSLFPASLAYDDALGCAAFLYLHLNPQFDNAVWR